MRTLKNDVRTFLSCVFYFAVRDKTVLGALCVSCVYICPVCALCVYMSCVEAQCVYMSCVCPVYIYVLCGSSVFSVCMCPVCVYVHVCPVCSSVLTQLQLRLVCL